MPVVAVLAEQAWFWTERWQAMEREADADAAAGRATVVGAPAMRWRRIGTHRIFRTP